ncbi:hypothetical protein [Stenotrophomonas sp.]|uniref:hypothetical protein n=1 Tax=Stenotrophomonas sp. TaxID=69392 RepID=UPI002FC6F793
MSALLLLATVVLASRASAGPSMSALAGVFMLGAAAAVACLGGGACSGRRKATLAGVGLAATYAGLAVCFLAGLGTVR